MWCSSRDNFVIVNDKNNVEWNFIHVRKKLQDTLLHSSGVCSANDVWFNGPNRVPFHNHTNDSTSDLVIENDTCGKNEPSFWLSFWYQSIWTYKPSVKEFSLDLFGQTIKSLVMTTVTTVTNIKFGLSLKTFDINGSPWLHTPRRRGTNVWKNHSIYHSYYIH